MMLFGLAMLMLAGTGLRAANAQSLLRDAETERAINEMIRPILIAGGLDPAAVRIYLINDNNINAFVYGGQNIFIHTGLILQSDNVNQVLGVLAHETGHITGGHLRRRDEQFKGASAYQIAGLILGAAAIAAGAGDAGIGLLLGGQTAALRSALKYSRAQEAAADQAGAGFLETAEISGLGMLETFDKFRDQEYLRQVNQDPYVRSHPLNSARIASLEDRVTNSRFFNKPPDPATEDAFQRLKAKLAGYVYTPPRVALQIYPESDQSVYGRYARVYAYDRMRRWDDALAEADSLIAEFPDNPYYYEIKGQILFENGRVAESLEPYKKAFDLAPDEPLIMSGYGQALVAMETPEYDALALPVLRTSARLDRENGFTFYQLAIVYTRLGDPARADLMTAERMMLYGQYGQAARHASLAIRGLDSGTPEWLRAQDVAVFAESSFREQQGGRRRR